MSPILDIIYRFILLAAAGIFMFVTTNQVLSGKLNLSPNGLSRFNNLKTFVDKLQFTLIHLALPVLLLKVQVLLTIFKRLSTNAIDPSSKNENLVFRANSVLRNYVEQFIISAFAQLVLISHLSAKQTSQFIPLMNLFFVVGRVTFWAGYPRSRSFGFFCCLIPSITATCLSAYEFLVFVNLVR